MALAACCDGYTVLSGDHSLRHIRLCQPLIDALNSLGAWAVSTKGDGHAPDRRSGQLRGGSTEIDGMDSQPVSALLIASSLAVGPDGVDRPPRRREALGRPDAGLAAPAAAWSSATRTTRRYRIRGNSRWKGFEARIPLDWSAALYPIVAAVLTQDSEVQLPGMDFNDSQGDKAVVDVLQEMGADIEVKGDTVIARSSKLDRPPDRLQRLHRPVHAAGRGGRVRRGRDGADQRRGLPPQGMRPHRRDAQGPQGDGRHVEERPDGLVVRQSRLHGATLDSRGDHRMVMTLAVAAPGRVGPDADPATSSASRRPSPTSSSRCRPSAAI